MTITLLTLPRELRDQIYAYVLLSPSGTVTPTPCRQTESLGGKPRFTLRVEAPERASNKSLDFSCPPRRSSSSVPYEYSITLSLRRTCRLIYDETKDLFWSRNVFVFDHVNELMTTLKGMGQVPSRRITSIKLRMGTSAVKGTRVLAKAFRILASRARLGSLRTLELEFDWFQFGLLVGTRDRAHVNPSSLYDVFLELLRIGSEVCGERSLRINTPNLAPYSWKRIHNDIIRELHFAWGGKFFWDDVLLWDELREIGVQARAIIESPHARHSS